jgi:membrane protease YdiL (CAAX protease family)
MSNIFIPILLISYAAILLTIAGVNKQCTISYQKLQPGDLINLNNLHAIVIIIMLLPGWAANPFPDFLLSLPRKINIIQTATLLICFAAILFFPWEKAKEEITNHGVGYLSVPEIILYAFLRIIFIAIYEWFFRGLTLISFEEWLGATWAVVINILLYTLAHFHKNKREIIACIPFGLFACVLTLWCQSIWPAIVFHVQIAILNEWRPLSRLISPPKHVIL